MPNIRFSALEEASKRKPVDFSSNRARVSEIYGTYTFNQRAMQEYMSREAYGSVLSAIEKGTKIDRGMADQIASGMKSWAIAMGATHYTHWFQPLTGATAEKDD